MIRLTVQTTDFNESSHVGGPPITYLKTFVVNAPELEAHLHEYERAKEDYIKTGKFIWWNRQIVGFEILPAGMIR